MKTRYKVAIAKVLSRIVRFGVKIVGGQDVVRVRRGELQWALDLREGIDLAVYLGVYEPETMAAYRKLVRPGFIALDIGANMGAHTLPLAKLCGPAGKVVAFEPTQFAFEKLAANVRLNPDLAGTVQASQVMLVAKDGGETPGALYSSWPLENSEAVHQHHCGRLMSTAGASSMTLDRFVAEAGIDHVDLIKMDVDGHEPEVMSGALDTLRKFQPLIIMELAPYQQAEEGQSIGQLLDFLVELGYQFFDLSRWEPISDPRRVVESIPLGSGYNVALVPASGLKTVG